MVIQATRNEPAVLYTSLEIALGNYPQETVSMEVPVFILLITEDKGNRNIPVLQMRKWKLRKGK